VSYVIISPYRDSANAGKRGAVHKYRTLILPQDLRARCPRHRRPELLPSLVVGAPDARRGLGGVRAWGFTLKTMKGFTWHKTTKHGKSHFGMGHWTRANTEDCLFAVRGKPKRANAGVPQFIEAHWSRHSAKPDEVRQRLVRLMGDVPRLEMFAREAIPGWDVWGNEIESTVELGTKK
jgi:N6-adenosine-specific RNA methylase IME4